MFLLQRNITGRRYHTIIAAIKVVDFLKVSIFTEVINNFATDFVYECLCRHNQSIVLLCSVNDLILDKHPHNEGLAHGSRSRIAEAIIGQMIIGCFLSSKKLLIRFRGNRKIVISEIGKESLQCCNILIFGIDVFDTLVVSDTRKDISGIELNQGILRVEFIQEDYNFLCPDFMCICLFRIIGF